MLVLYGNDFYDHDLNSLLRNVRLKTNNLVSWFHDQHYATVQNLKSWLQTPFLCSFFVLRPIQNLFGQVLLKLGQCCQTVVPPVPPLVQLVQWVEGLHHGGNAGNLEIKGLDHATLYFHDKQIGNLRVDTNSPIQMPRNVTVWLPINRSVHSPSFLLKGAKLRSSTGTCAVLLYLNYV